MDRIRLRQLTPIAATVLLAACGSGGSPSPQAAGSPTPSATPSAGVSFSPGPIDLTASPTSSASATSAPASNSPAPTVTPTSSATAKSSGSESVGGGRVNLLSGCAAGTVLASHEAGGVRIRIMQRAFGVDLCLTLPGGTAVHADTDGQSTYGLDAKPFDNGSWFRTDSLGHVFARIDPGTVAGVTVVVPGGAGAEVFGFPEATLDTGTDPYRITTRINDCVPDCARGRTTTGKVSWDATTRTYR